MSKFLILLAVYNGKPYLTAQMESIFRQEQVRFDLLIGDDCSTDGAVDEAVDELEKQPHGQGIQVLRFQKPSGGAARNFLRLLCHANLDNVDFVAFSDQDDIWHSDKLSRAVRMLKSHDADVYSSAVTAFWPDGKERVLDQNPKQTPLDFMFEGMGQGCTFVLCAGFARQVQQFIGRKIADLSDVHYHDWLIYAISRALHKRWIFDPHPTMRYRQHGGNDTGGRGTWASVRRRLGLIRNGWYAKQVAQIIEAVSCFAPDDSRHAVIPADFLSAWTRPCGFRRRLELARLLLKHGRRRFSDRLILSASALLGWL